MKTKIDDKIEIIRLYLSNIHIGYWYYDENDDAMYSHLHCDDLRLIIHNAKKFGIEPKAISIPNTRYYKLGVKISDVLSNIRDNKINSILYE